MTVNNQLPQAVGLLNEGRSKEALLLLRPLQSALAQSADFWQLIALAYKGEGQFADAEQAFHQSIALAEQPHVLTNLANFYRQRNDSQRALTFYERALLLEL